MRLFLAASRPWMWEELWKWQLTRKPPKLSNEDGWYWRQGAAPPREILHTCPPVPDKALFVSDADVWNVSSTPGEDLVAGLGLHEARSYVFIEDLTTNPQRLTHSARTCHKAVELLLLAAQQYAVSVAKPICAFTAVPSLYRMARRLGYSARPAGALLVFASLGVPLTADARALVEKKNRAARGDKSRAARLTVDGENVPVRKDNGTPRKVPRQDVTKGDKVSKVKEANGEKARHRRLHPR